MPSPAKLLASASGAATDPNFRNVTLLLHGDGSNGAQNNTFLDSSSNNFTVTRNGNTTQGSFTPYGSYWSNYFDGSTGYLSVNAQTALSYGTGDFTMEAWVYPTSINSGFAPVIEARASASATTYAFGLRVSGGVYKTELYIGTQYTGSTTVSLNTWTHIAVSRSSGTLRLFVNGVLDTSWSSITTSVDANAASQLIGVLRDGAGYYFPGYISNFRAVKGTAVYTSNFTPPTAPLTAITNTSLLTCQSNRFRDASTNNFAITRNGDVRVTPLSPYAPTAPYSAAVDGGSTYYDGNGDWLSVANNTAFVLDATFTLEAWVYPNRDYSTYQTIITKRAGDTPAAWQLYINITNGYLGYYNGSGYNSSTPVPLNQWSHVAAVYDGANINLYMNGVRVLQSATTNTDQNTGVKIGYHFSSIAEPFQGYIADARIVKNAQVYSGATYTVPSAPLTAITGTSLLLRGTNAAIFDSAADNDLETVGNAQISTSVKKFGTGSMAFDGTGDYLRGANSDLFAFGTGDFTVEAWVYFTDTTATNRAIFDTGVNSNTGRLLIRQGNDLGGAANVVDTYLSGAVATSPTFSFNQWVHVAAVRSSGTLKVYINGIGGTGVSATGNLTQTGCLIGAFYDQLSWNFTGYVDDLRVTRGVARYTANFTPPAAPFPDQ